MYLCIPFNEGTTKKFIDNTERERGKEIRYSLWSGFPGRELMGDREKAEGSNFYERRIGEE